MNNNLTELVLILDKSGSMHGLEEDTIGGFNSMIDKQKKAEGDALVTTILFSDNSHTIHDRISLEDIGSLTDNQYIVGGCTALIDAIGSTVEHISLIHKYIREEDVPAHTMFVIITDGLENASRKFSSDEVKKMIEEKKESGWEFLFLGANIDAVETAKHFGIDENHSVTYRCDAVGTSINYSAISDAVSEVRKGRRVCNRNWCKDIESYSVNKN